MSMFLRVFFISINITITYGSSRRDFIITQTFLNKNDKRSKALLLFLVGIKQMIFDETENQILDISTLRK